MKLIKVCDTRGASKVTYSPRWAGKRDKFCLYMHRIAGRMRNKVRIRSVDLFCLVIMGQFLAAMPCKATLIPWGLWFFTLPSWFVLRLAGNPLCGPLIVYVFCVALMWRHLLVIRLTAHLIKFRCTPSFLSPSSFVFVWHLLWAFYLQLPAANF